MGLSLLTDLVVILGAAVLVAYVFARLKLPVIVGLFVAGVAIGPDGLGLVADVHDLEAVAEIGVVLLLFAIGIEFSLRELVSIKDIVLLAGTLQIGLTALVGCAVSLALGRTLTEAVFLGFLMALSSTAIVLKSLQQRAEIDAPHGRGSLGILIFQDLMVVPLTLLVPLLAGDLEMNGSPVVLLGKAVAVVVVALVGARWVVPWILREVARLGSPDVFLIAVLVIGFGVAAAAGHIGLSMALGAFVAGLVISESEYSHQVLGNVIPFRDVLLSFFFVSVGMLLDVSFLASYWWILVLATPVVIIGKATLASVAILALRFPLRTSLLTGISLAQVGEFAFVLAAVGAQQGILQEDVRQGFLAVSVLSMAATPLLITSKERIADTILRLPLPGALRRGGRAEAATHAEPPRDHLVIIGFGLNGRNLARVAAESQIPYIILELNPRSVHSAQEAGEPMLFGDATNVSVLERAGVPYARVVVVVISDPVATRRIVALVRRLNPDTHLIARTRYVIEVPFLLEAGASDVVPEEFETAVEIFVRTLQQYLVPLAEIERVTAEIRADGYELLRLPHDAGRPWKKIQSALPGVEVTTLQVRPEGAAVGRTLADIDLRRTNAVTLLALSRAGELTPNPGGDTRIEPGDVVVLLGRPEAIVDVRSLFAPCVAGDDVC
ncbi:MAG: cation:proton antiporter domain-containing protein [Thermoleophilia bacterium]